MKPTKVYTRERTKEKTLEYSLMVLVFFVVEPTAKGAVVVSSVRGFPDEVKREGEILSLFFFQVLSS
jgi:PII-like signaling protein